jgi:hypothetical protein
MIVLLKILGGMFRDQDVSSISTVHYPLRDVDSGAGNVCILIHVDDLVYRSAVNSHSQLNVWTASQRLADLQRALHRRFRARPKHESHAVAGR